MPRRLSRERDGRPAAPVRILHLGLGNFTRAHQAWYTENAPDADQWGIAAFTGRSLGVAEQMREQDCVYSLIVQDPEANTYQTISSIVATHHGKDVGALLDYFADPELAIVTSTVTEAGYVRNSAGELDTDNPDVAADIEALRNGRPTEVRTAPGKFVAGLLRRREAGAGAITFCPCDNIPESGEVVESVIRSLTGAVDQTLLAWIDENVGFVTTMVDRITPRPTAAMFQSLTADTGIEDPAAVATEPFAQWVLSGDFKAGRPQWEAAGAQFVDEILPYETLKLWMLNGSHSLMAYAATIKGHATVFDAITDPEVRGWVEEWWDVAARQLSLPVEAVDAYRTALVERFSNPNIRHLLAQIAADGSNKLPIRVVPALNTDREDGQQPTGAERVVAAWVLHLRGQGAPVNDARAEVVKQLAAGTLEESVAKVCDFLEIPDPAARANILSLANQLSAE